MAWNLHPSISSTRLARLPIHAPCVSLCSMDGKTSLGTALASDQPYREFDIAIDFCEDVERLPEAAIDRIVELPQLATRASAVPAPVLIVGATALARGDLHRECSNRRNTPVRRADSARSLAPNGDILCKRLVHKLQCTFGR